MPRALALLAAFLFAMTAAAWAQQSEPAMGSAAGESAQSSDNQNIGHILVIGDALGGGLGAGMQRMAEPVGRYDVTIRYNEESGLARPEVYDWNARLPGILDKADFDAIVVMMGSNDRQQIRAGNLRYAFNSADWVKAYSQQLDSLLDRLMASGARVYWIGLPPMADPVYDQAMQAVSALQRERVEARGATYLDMRPYFIGSDGQYTDMGVDDLGDRRKLRGKDGVSFFKQGNNRMGQIVLAAIGQVAPIEPPQAAGKTNLAAEAATPAPRPAEVPVFGQMAGQFGEELLVQPQDVVATVVLIAGDGAVSPGTPEQILAALAAAAKPGSRAATLFASGTAGAPPKGRLDDYSLPPSTDEN